MTLFGLGPWQGQVFGFLKLFVESFGQLFLRFAAAVGIIIQVWVVDQLFKQDVASQDALDDIGSIQTIHAVGADHGSLFGFNLVVSIIIIVAALVIFGIGIERIGSSSRNHKVVVRHQVWLQIFQQYTQSIPSSILDFGMKVIPDVLDQGALDGGVSGTIVAMDFQDGLKDFIKGFAQSALITLFVDQIDKDHFGFIFIFQCFLLFGLFAFFQ
mmetsp:Transcript_26909/g.65378  ORF Transcript_26909/g.65378 Transcript_26909/m.65378 type:complete len:213 (+) Transcript_26909:1164-1802(+)